MDIEWCQDRLRKYLDALEAYDRSSTLGSEWQEMHQRFPTVQAILRSLRPGIQEFDLNYPSTSTPHRSVVLRALGMLEDRAVLNSKLAPDAPVLAADGMHPWVWHPARPLWEIQQFRLALLAAATTINRKLQDKVGRRDASDDKLIEQCFSENAPEPRKPRLRVPGEHNDTTVKSRQLGTLHFALGCIKTIRNPVAHDPGELNEQAAFEQLATLSTLARFLDECEVLTVDEKDQDEAT